MPQAPRRSPPVQIFAQLIPPDWRGDTRNLAASDQIHAARLDLARRLRAHRKGLIDWFPIAELRAEISRMERRFFQQVLTDWLQRLDRSQEISDRTS